MTEQELILSLVFRDGARPAEIQLLLSYLSEILKEMQIAESEEENARSSLCPCVHDTPSGE
ncbi:MAG: hypothetical protein EOM37_08805 [Proteobacteria bacterium]|jgi:hypothetical protein|nr:hypothetical protein [Alphaproteobacteria bacterium]NCC04124.1 hypothetical protein [Pseudomonadota bacterium]